MTNQQKKQYLNRYVQSKNRYNAISEEMLRIRSEACRVSPVLSDIPVNGSHISNKIEQAIEQLDACANDLEKESIEMRQLMQEVKAAINTIPDETLKQLLELRYINGYTWEQIAVKMNYTWRHVLRLHGEALKHVIVCHTQSC